MNWRTLKNRTIGQSKKNNHKGYRIQKIIQNL